jgi:hypothetical protein
VGKNENLIILCIGVPEMQMAMPSCSAIRTIL